LAVHFSNRISKISIGLYRFTGFSSAYSGIRLFPRAAGSFLEISMRTSYVRLFRDPSEKTDWLVSFTRRAKDGPKSPIQIEFFETLNETSGSLLRDCTFGPGIENLRVENPLRGVP
jgi:hypothetical protein